MKCFAWVPRSRRTLLAGGLAGLLAWCSASGAGETIPTAPPKADRATQSLLRSLAATTSETVAESGFSRLKTVYAGRHPELVQQLFLFARYGRGARAGMLPGVVIKSLEVSNRDLVLGVSPWLENTDETSGARARNWLGQVERVGDTQRLDYSTYAEILADPKGHAVEALVRHMMAVDAPAARDVLNKVYGEEKTAAVLRAITPP